MGFAVLKHPGILLGHFRAFAGSYWKPGHTRDELGKFASQVQRRTLGESMSDHCEWTWCYQVVVDFETLMGRIFCEQDE